MFKKLIIPTTIFAVAIPLATTVSCGRNSAATDDKNQGIGLQDQDSKQDGTVVASYDNMMQTFQLFTLNNQEKIKPVSYDDLKASVDPKLPWIGGVAKFAISQACSYLYNLALKLGFNENVPDAKDLSEVSSGDLKLDSLRKETYEKIKATYGNLKAFDNDKLQEIQSKSYFKNVFLLESIGNQADERHLISDGIDISSFGADVQYSNSDPNGKLFSFPNTTFTSPTGESIDLTKGLVASQFINANQPGTVSTILEIPRIFDKNDNVVVDSFRKKITTPGLVPTYPKSVSDDREDDLKVLDATLQKLSLIFASENAELTKTMKEDARGFKVSSPLIEALEFLGKNFKNVFSMKEVVNVYDSLNNGSHYFKAVEIFLRGASGINFAKNSTPNWAPQSSDDHSGIINMSIDHLERALLAWGNRQGNSSFLFENDNFVADYDFRTYVPMDK